MKTTINGRLVKVFKAIHGTNKSNKAWSKQDFLIDTGTDTENIVMITKWNSDIDVDKIPIGTDISVTCFIRSNEYNDKYYTNITAVTIQILDEDVFPEAGDPFTYAGEVNCDNAMPANTEGIQSDLPF